MEKNNYLISEMKIEDLENIKDILEVDFDEFWNYETLKEELESNFSKYFIAKQNDNIVGFAGLKIILDEADLMNIVTKKCCRHEGIASNIMDKLIEYCKQEKIKCINLEVNIQNSIAINFYKKYNFKENITPSGKQLALCSFKIAFRHPKTHRKLEFKIDKPFGLS